MLARVWCLLGAVTQAALCGPVWPADHVAYGKIAASVVRVVASHPDAAASLGSGVVLPGGNVATNCHVTRHAATLAITDGMTRIGVDGEIGDLGADLCVLHVGATSAPAVRVGDAARLKVGDEVFSVGFGGGLAKSVSPGRVTALFPYRGGYVIRSTAAFRPGASGGGLFDAQGNLVGITTFFRRGGNGFAFFAIPAEWIDRLALVATAAQPQSDPFWMRTQAEQPRFLQVAAFEDDGKWQDMAAAARAWVEEEPAADAARKALELALARGHGARSVPDLRDSAPAARQAAVE